MLKEALSVFRNAGGFLDRSVSLTSKGEHYDRAFAALNASDALCSATTVPLNHLSGLYRSAYNGAGIFCLQPLKEATSDVRYGEPIVIMTSRAFHLFCKEIKPEDPSQFVDYNTPMGDWPKLSRF